MFFLNKTDESFGICDFFFVDFFFWFWTSWIRWWRLMLLIPTSICCCLLLLRTIVRIQKCYTWPDKALFPYQKFGYLNSFGLVEIQVFLIKNFSIKQAYYFYSLRSWLIDLVFNSIWVNEFNQSDEAIVDIDDQAHNKTFCKSDRAQTSSEKDSR